MAENGPAGENDSNQHNDKGFELSGISLTPDLLFFFLALSKESRSGQVGVFCILKLTLFFEK